MPETTHWSFPPELQPAPTSVRFNLRAVGSAVVRLRSDIPDDAFTATLLGTERFGNGVVIRDDGLVLTIGYLITEAESVWLTTHDGRIVPAHPLAYDFASGFGLVVPLGRLDLPALPRASTAAIGTGTEVNVIGFGGRAHALRARVIARREFAGYWEYVLDEAIFTAPAHPEWSGAALVDDDGSLIGIGSLFVEEPSGESSVQANMFVPIDLIEPVLDDLATHGRRLGPVRPWIGMYTIEIDGHLVANGVAERGPAQVAGVRPGDRVLEVDGRRVTRLAELFRAVWKCGPAGSEIPLTVMRDDATLHLRVASIDRNDILRKPRLQ